MTSCPINSTHLLLAPIILFYAPAALWLFLYGINNYYMIYLFLRTVKRESLRNSEFLAKFWLTNSDTLPKVTTQLPIYNEKNVAERLINAVINIQYPKELHEIQVLDDSHDETRDIVVALVKKYKDLGYNVKHITREKRTGFKAGALNTGLEIAEGEFLAIFDADFLPDEDFLYKTIPFFYETKKVALVQTRWGYINRNYSLLTIVQSIGIDGHFIIEQGARTWNGFYMNFNGTAGVWRKEAILDAGGWHYDTLTEDLDLSYRAQLKGWKTKFISDVVTPSEIPITVNAYKSQQHRWAKGSIQTARKILPHVFQSHDTLIKKIQAFIHLSQYMVHPMMIIIALLSYPLVFLLKSINRLSVSFMVEILWGFIFLSTFAPLILYMISQKTHHKDWLKRCIFIPTVIIIGCGIAINNTKAVAEALLNVKSDFIRTPKYGVIKRDQNTVIKDYALTKNLNPVSEILFGIYCCAGFIQYVVNKEYIFGYFLLVCTLGFFYIGTFSFLENVKRKKI
ncbi:MAG: glycosyltransferase [wastewater metagenome]|nr:glycosyltransferase [Candidatus Loosdrechtia aerotolerans]